MIEYAVPRPPSPGASLEVAPGVHWLRMPLPFALDHVNLWLLADGDGWTLIDTGIADAATRAAWEAVLAGPLGHAPLRRVIATHYHPDHLGLAGWLVERLGAELRMTDGEQRIARRAYAGEDGHGVDRAVAHFRRHGLDEERLAALRDRGNHYRAGLSPLPAAIVTMADGDEIAIGGRAWTVIVGRGHSPEHASLRCDELDLLVSGDMVLPSITTNVSAWAADPEGDPLGRFLDSLPRFDPLPPSTLVLPSHGRPFRGLGERLAALRAHHAERLAHLLDACDQPRSAADLLDLLFRRQLDVHQLAFAMGEAIAHLNHLLRGGRLEAVDLGDGVLRVTRR